MANFTYTTIIFKDTTNVIGAEPNNAANLTDFETNFKSQANSISVFQGSDPFINVLYGAFKAVVDGVTVKWTDVQYVEGSNSYTLYAIKGNSSFVSGPDGAGFGPTHNPIYIATLDAGGNLRPFRLTADGSLLIAGADVEGNGPTHNPIYIASKDVSGNLRPLKILADGTLQSTIVSNKIATQVGLYYAHSGRFTVQASAHGATAGFMWFVNTSSTVKARLRRIWITEVPTAASVFATSPRMTIERVTFTGTPSGTTVSPAKRNSGDASNTATVRTTSTGMSLTAGNTVRSAVIGAILTGVGIAVPVVQEFEFTGEDDMVVLGQNEGLVFRQPDAGSTADTRLLVIDIEWEEF